MTASVSTRALRLLVGSVFAVLLNISLLAPIASAATIHPDPMPSAAVVLRTADPIDPILDRVNSLAKSLSKVATPIAILGIILVLLFVLFSPILPEFAQANKGYIIKALVIVAVIGLIPEIVKAFASMGGSGS